MGPWADFWTAPVSLLLWVVLLAPVGLVLLRLAGTLADWLCPLFAQWLQSKRREREGVLPVTQPAPSGADSLGGDSPSQTSEEARHERCERALRRLLGSCPRSTPGGGAVLPGGDPESGHGPLAGQAAQRTSTGGDGGDDNASIRTTLTGVMVPKIPVLR